ncbi:MULTISPECIES: aminoglycoside 6-adenylyltransferase [Paenibacillus]|uniref:Adenylyltransferase n=1 Tax=Paenibacillus borealis TaxID=160799 RepID=A0ABX3HIM2_PAEBO|nr:aminoglycoside 6-adenylyltransferase [Paenibacillus borealis]OMD49542.1 adenylyltransferase [Paenibacillus borealis]
MHKDLEASFNKVVEILKKDQRCKGGWHYGSISRGAEDIYSDYDPVFLVADKDFESFAADVPTVLAAASDELLIFWGESFNNEYFKNYCSVLRIGSQLHQFDFFIINADYPEEWMCRQHCKGCTRDQLIFDRAGETAAFLDQGYRTDNNLPDTVRAMDTYWLHTEMLIKYFKRKDLFKIIKNMDVLFHSHVDLLLSWYDTLDWGAWESKVKLCVPEEKQEHLKAYYTTAEFHDLEAAVKKSIALFQVDAAEICKAKGIEYPDKIAAQITAYFHNRIDSEA